MCKLGNVIKPYMFKHLHAQCGCQESTPSRSSTANLLHGLMQAQSLALGQVLAPPQSQQAAVVCIAHPRVFTICMGKQRFSKPH